MELWNKTWISQQGAYPPPCVSLTGGGAHLSTFFVSSVCSIELGSNLTMKSLLYKIHRNKNKFFLGIFNFGLRGSLIKQLFLKKTFRFHSATSALLNNKRGCNTSWIFSQTRIFGEFLYASLRE